MFDKTGKWIYFYYNNLNKPSYFMVNNYNDAYRSTLHNIYIYHPATRGEVRNIEKYKKHVKERIGHIV